MNIIRVLLVYSQYVGRVRLKCGELKIKLFTFSFSKIIPTKTLLVSIITRTLVKNDSKQQHFI